MNDQELLEAAAKASGMIGDYGGLHDLPEWWNPLDNDGDALRLAIKMQITITPATDSTIALAKSASSDEGFSEHCMFDGDPFIATRRAIVRAAVGISGQPDTTESGK
jgi:hypothetical protein